VTAALALFAVTVAVTAGGLAVLAVLFAVRSWQETR